MEVEEESDEERIGTMRRSFSDSHLEKLKEAASKGFKVDRDPPILMPYLDLFLLI